MRNGTCGLCGKQGILKKSHLIPKAAYKYVRDHPSDGGKSPMKIEIAAGKFVRTDKQVDAHFLCGACELKFSQFGEATVSKLWATHFDFPLLNLLSASSSVRVSSRRQIFRPSQLPQELATSLYYFAISVMWRAIAWPCSAPGISSCKGTLSEEQLRDIKKFLIAPDRILDWLFVVIDVNTRSEVNGMLSLPSRTSSEVGEVVQFDILGMRFMLYVGPEFSIEVEFLRSEVNSYFVIASSDHAEGNSAKQIARFLHEHGIH